MGAFNLPLSSNSMHNNIFNDRNFGVRGGRTSQVKTWYLLRHFQNSALLQLKEYINHHHTRSRQRNRVHRSFLQGRRGNLFLQLNCDTSRTRSQRVKRQSDRYWAPRTDNDTARWVKRRLRWHDKCLQRLAALNHEAKGPGWHQKQKKDDQRQSPPPF